MASEAVDQSREPSAGNRSPPPHHARRPMNAFLIFCKRHRSVVRNRYPHLENRSITKILGEWWASLEPGQKEDYTDLARKYKEAFLEANPKFKWYKLPAPPLRTLMTRPSNQNKPHKLKCEVTGGPITPGKLADESQMGNLSSLLSVSPPTTPTNTNVNTLLNAPKPPKKRYLEDNELNGTSDTNSVIPNEAGLKEHEDNEIEEENESESPLVQLRTHAAQQLMNNGRTIHTSQQQIIDRVVESMWENGCENNNCTGNGSCCLPNNGSCDTTDNLSDEQRLLLNHNKDDFSDEGKSQRRQSYRTCKGQRYREFMSENNFNKKARRNLNNSLFEKMDGPMKRQRLESTSSDSNDSISHTPQEDSLSIHSLEQKQTDGNKEDKLTEYPEELIQEPAIKKRNHSETSDGYHSDSSSVKRFKATDFNLDEKIEALPSLSLEEFQMKKKARKKRPIGHFTSKPSTVTITSEMNQSPLVGSQKRKAPKQRIIRLDLEHNTKDTAVVEPDVLNNIGLATLAEVAASINFERL